MTSLWWAGEFTEAPSLVEMISTENRGISVSLAGAMNEGETLVGLPSIVLRHWRNKTPYPGALVGDPLWDAQSFVVTQKVDASELPVREHLVMEITFTVNLGEASENRAVVAAIWVMI